MCQMEYWYNDLVKETDQNISMLNKGGVDLKLHLSSGVFDSCQALKL